MFNASNAPAHLLSHKHILYIKVFDSSGALIVKREIYCSTIDTVDGQRPHYALNNGKLAVKFLNHITSHIAL